MRISASWFGSLGSTAYKDVARLIRADRKRAPPLIVTALRKQEREIAALKPLDNEKPIQAMVVSVAEKSGHDPVRQG